MTTLQLVALAIIVFCVPSAAFVVLRHYTTRNR